MVKGLGIVSIQPRYPFGDRRSYCSRHTALLGRLVKSESLGDWATVVTK